METVLKEIKTVLYHKKVLVACSTGVDSMTLLTLVEKLLPKENITVAHVNHQRRKASEDEENYIKNYCLDHQLKCEVLRLSKNKEGNFQEWARKKRYEFFQEVALKNQSDVILLAHHADDNLETILMRIIKTSSLKGYAGINKWSKYQGIDIYRPLINTPKDEIIRFAKANKITYFEDESNQHDDYTRNRIRHNVIPILKEENPNIYEAIKNYQETILCANNLLEKVKVEFIENKVLVNNKIDANKENISFKLSDFLELDESIRVHVLFRILKKYSLSRKCIDDIIKQITSKSNRIITSINNELSMIKEYGWIIFTNQSLKPLDFYLKINKEGSYELPNNQVLIVEKNICYFKTVDNAVWYNNINLPVVVRSRQDGDKITTKIGSKTVSDYLTNKKIPYLQRKDTLLLCDENNNIIGILGYILK